jgi:hypothetical protein
MEGIYFYGRSRRKLFETQRKIDRAARYVTVLSPPARDLWTRCFGPRDNLLLVPGAAESDLPPPGPDPYGDAPRPRCVFAGNVYTSRTQPKANRVLLSRLNDLGQRLSERGIQLFLVGSGDLRGLDRAHVTWLGSVPYAASWDYLHHADVGILVAAGPFMHNNESTKIYHYLRAGLPVVSEAGFPNDWVLHESKHAFVVENGNMEQLADRAEQATRQSWDRAQAIEYILQQHTWDARVEVYDRLIREHCA